MKPLIFIKRLLASDSDFQQRLINVEMNAKYGHGLSFKDIAALRKAFKAGKYDSVAPDVFARVEAGAARRAAVKHRKTRSRSREPLARVAKVRGERRGPKGRGRRNVDALYISFEDMPNHLVVAYHDGHMEDFRFKAKDDAKQCIVDLVAQGISPSRIGYYQRSDFGYSVNVNLGAGA